MYRFIFNTKIIKISRIYILYYVYACDTCVFIKVQKHNADDT